MIKQNVIDTLKNLKVQQNSKKWPHINAKQVNKYYKTNNDAVNIIIQ